MFDYLIKILCFYFPRVMLFLVVVVFSALVFGWRILIFYALVFVLGIVWLFTSSGGGEPTKVQPQEPLGSPAKPVLGTLDDQDEELEEDLEDEIYDLEDEIEDLKDEIEDEELEKFLRETSATERQERLDQLTEELERLKAMHERLCKKS